MARFTNKRGSVVVLPDEKAEARAVALRTMGFTAEGDTKPVKKAAAKKAPAKKPAAKKSS